MNTNRINSKVSLLCLVLGACLALLLLSPCAWAEVVMPAGEAQTHAMAGGFALLRQPGQEDPYGPSTPFPSFPVWFDTGASGNLISYGVASALGIPTTGETYEDIGIAGNETFDVSELTELLLVPSLKQPSYNDYAYADQMSSYSSYGDFNLQMRQSDKEWDEWLTGQYNVIGSPVLNNYVMRVRPNSVVHQFDLLSGYYPMLYMETALLDELPSDLPAASTIEIPLAYTDFVLGDPPVSVADNPVIPDVRLVDGSFSGSAHDWLFDTGASLTIISKGVAAEVGIDEYTSAVSTAQIGGIGGSITIFGYEIDELILPSNDETQLIFTDAVVYVIDWAEPVDLPAGLQGIFGMNLINKSIDSVLDWLYMDLVLHPEYLTNSPFVEWYVDPFGSQLLLVLQGGDVDGNGYVDGTDLTIIISNWGLSDATRGQGDLDGNGVVDGPDYTEVLSFWGQGSPPGLPPEPAPEPATLVLLTAGLVILAVVRARPSPHSARPCRS